MPSLAVPFATFGAAAGFFAILAIGAFRPAARSVSPYLPMLVTAAAGGVVGTALRRWSHLQESHLPRETVATWIAVLVAIAGAVSGGVVGYTMWGDDGVMRFFVGGAIVGLVFTPSCLVVFDAARRAGRGRHGSLVAGTDARTVLSTVLAGIAFAAATQVPAVLAAQASSHLTPLLQFSLSTLTCLGATAGIVVLQRRDCADAAALEAFTKESAWLDRVASERAPDEPDGLPKGAVDLGLGDDQWARGDKSYRSSGRADVLVKGSVADANAAFEECAQRRHRSLLVAVSALTAVSMSLLLRLGMFL